MPLVSEPMATPQRVHITHEFTSDPQTVFDKLAEHENLGPVFGATIARVSDGATSRNGAGSVRRRCAARNATWRAGRACGLDVNGGCGRSDEADR